MRIRGDLLDLWPPSADYSKEGCSRGDTRLDFRRVFQACGRREAFMPSFQRIPCLLSSLAISMALVGCVGPRLPSDRYLQNEVSTEFHAPETFSPGPSQCELDEDEPPKEIPWPMFHPIPTRPVFGGSGP